MKNSPNQNKTLHVLISGRVQGVGFRYSMRAAALRIGISGWVKNRGDGSVEALIQGSEEQTGMMLSWCEQGPAMAQVSRVETECRNGEPEYDGFTIRG